MTRTKARIATLLLLLASYSCGGTAAAVEIQNFRAGLVCGEGQFYTWVCFETDEIQVVGQGSCIYAGEAYRCTWHGFEFDYMGAEPGLLIECIAETDQPTNPGDPDQVFDEETTSFPYELELEEVDGHYFIAQYQVFTIDAPPIEEETVCSASGEEVLRFRTRYVFPVSPD